jgi:ABC-type nitrate/sulfonate/bicarbonate transport system substrate-binding protein
MGTRFLQENADQATPFAAKWLDVAPSEVKSMLAGVKLYGMRENATLFRDGVPVRSLDEITAFYLERKAITKPVKGNDMIDASLVWPH